MSLTRTWKMDIAWKSLMLKITIDSVTWNGWMICLIVLGFIIPLKKFSLIWRRHHCRCKFWPMLGTHGHWGFFSVPHLLWQGASVYNGHLRGPKTLTPVAGHLAVELSLPVFTTWVCRDWDSNSQPSACEANALTHYATATVVEWCLL